MTKAKQTKQRIKTRIYNMLYHTSVGLSVCLSSYNDCLAVTVMSVLRVQTDRLQLNVY